MVAIGLSLGINCGYAINPARDLGPRLFTAIIYGKSVFTGKLLKLSHQNLSKIFQAGNYHFWIPIFGPIVGAFFGAVVYLLFVGAHKANEVQTPQYKIEEEMQKGEKLSSISCEQNSV